MGIEILKGLVLSSVEQVSDREIRFTAEGNRYFQMHHYQECCESVDIEDICGDLNDLVGSPITEAEESTKRGETKFESETWTFYKISTIKGTVTIRWYGESSGYYSEEVDFEEVGEWI